MKLKQWLKHTPVGVMVRTLRIVLWRNGKEQSRWRTEDPLGYYNYYDRLSVD